MTDGNKFLLSFHNRFREMKTSKLSAVFIQNLEFYLKRTASSLISRTIGFVVTQYTTFNFKGSRFDFTFHLSTYISIVFIASNILDKPLA